MAAPLDPQNVTATVDANDQITVSWEFDYDWFAFDGSQTSDRGGFSEGYWYSSSGTDNFHIQISRDGASFVDPSGGPTTVSYDGNGSYSAVYSPNSDESYDSVVGVDSSFEFRVRAENATGSSNWITTDTVYTDPLPPHNPSINRPTGNTFQLDYTVQSDIAGAYNLYYREDTGSGYGSWAWLETGTTDFVISGDPTTKGSSVTLEFSTSDTFDSGETLQEDARYQFRLRQKGAANNRLSEWVYTDYGNASNVYFEDDFESGDLSNWDTVNNDSNNAGVSNGSHGGTGVGGPDQGSYYFKGYGENDIEGTWIQKNLGDLSNESNIFLKCAFAIGSLDNSSENFGIEWYDGASWQDLERFYWEHNEQGWHEITTVVPDSWLSTDNRVRIGTTTSSGMSSDDKFAVDRVIMSDILHEYTSPAVPSNPYVVEKSASQTIDGRDTATITIDWTDNGTFNTKWGANKEWKKTSVSSWETEWDGGKPYTIPEHDNPRLEQGQKYDIRIKAIVEQDRHGSRDGVLQSSPTPSFAEITPLPSPSSLSATTDSDTSLQASWTDNANDENGFRAYWTTDDFVGLQFDGTDDTAAINDDSVFDNATEGITISIEFASRQDDKSDSASFVQKDAWGKAQFFTFDEQNGTISFSITDSAGNYYRHFVENVYSYDTRTRVTFVYDPASGDMLAYDESGSLLETKNIGDITPLNTNEKDVTIASGGSSGPWKGDLGEFAIWDRALSQSEVQSHSTGNFISDGLIGYWPFDQVSSGVSPDQSPYSNGASLSGPTRLGSLTQGTDISANSTSHTITGLTDDTTYNVAIEAYTEDTTTRAGFESATTYLNASRSVTSHVTMVDTTSLGVADYRRLAGASYVDLIDTQTTRGPVTLVRTPTSHTRFVDSQADRWPVDLARVTTSHTAAADSIADRLLTVDRDPTSHVGLIDASSSRTIGVSRPEPTSHVSTIDSATTGIASLNRSPTSHTSPITSTVTDRGLTVSRLPISHVSLIDASSSRTIGANRPEPTSHANAVHSQPDRLADYARIPESYVALTTSTNDRTLHLRRQALIEGAGRTVAYSDATDALQGTPRLDIFWDNEERAYVSEWFGERSFLSDDDRDIAMIVDGTITMDGIRVSAQHDSDLDGDPEYTTRPTRLLAAETPTVMVTGRGEFGDGQYRFVFEDIGIDDHLDGITIAFVHDN